MVLLILYDFIPPPSPMDLTTANAFNDDEYCLVDENLSKLLNSVWKQQADQLITRWKSIDSYLNELKTVQKLQYVIIPQECTDDALVAIHVVKLTRQVSVFMQLSQQLRDKFEIALRAVSHFGDFYQLLNSHLKHDKRICLNTVKYFPKSYYWFPDAIKNDRDVVMRALKSKVLFRFSLPAQFRSDTEVVKLYVKTRKLSTVYSELSAEVLDDRQVGINAVKKCAKSVSYLSERLQHDVSFMMECVKQNYFSFSEFPKSMREDRELVRKLLMRNLPLFLISYEFRKDKELVGIRIAKNFGEVQYVNNSVLDREYFLSYLNSNANPIPCNFFDLIPEHLLSDFELIKLAIARNCFTYRNLKECYKTRQVTEYYLSSTAQTGYCIVSDLPPEQLRDRELVIRCIQQSSFLYQIPSMYRYDKEIIKMALKIAIVHYKSDLLLSSFINDSLTRDKKFMKTLVEEIPELKGNKYYDFTVL